MITGHDRDEIGMLVFPSAAGAPRCRREELAAALRARAARAARRGRRLVADARCARWCSPTPPDIDAGEITDKGYINQRAVLTRRAAEVERLHGSAADPEVVRLD